MKKQVFRYGSILLIMGLLYLLSGCSGEDDDGTGYRISCTIAGNPECLDPQYTENQHAQVILDAILEGLLRLDETGTLIPAGAESYTISEDKLVYEFKLRNDCCWVSADTEEKYAKPVTALDYVFAFQRLLNPETGSPYAEDYLCLKNASAIVNGTCKPDKLGVSAPDGATVRFTLEYPETDFLYLLAQSCAVPCNEDFFLSTNGRYGLNEKAILCNGPFCLKKWAYDDYGSGNFLTCQKNNTYHDAESVSPGSLQFTIMRSQAEADEDFAEGNADVILTDTYPVNYLESDEYIVSSTCTQTLGLIFNPENELLQNQKFREAIACGTDRSSYAGRLSGSLQPASGIIPPAVRILGRSYRELYADEPLSIPYSPERSADLFAEALVSVPMKEINALKILIPDTFTDTEALLSVCQEWQNLSGHYIGIESVSVREYQNRLKAGEYSIALYTLEAQRNSSYAVLQDISAVSGLENTELNAVMKTISDTSSLSDQIALYGSAEKAILETDLFIPLFYQNLYLIYTRGNTDIFCRPFNHSIDFRNAKYFA